MKYLQRSKINPAKYVTADGEIMDWNHGFVNKDNGGPTKKPRHENSQVQPALTMTIMGADINDLNLHNRNPEVMAESNALPTTDPIENSLLDLTRRCMVLR
jgi:hypothetical protein